MTSSMQPWRAVIYFIADTPIDDREADDLADAITESFESMNEIAGRAVVVVKVQDLDTISEAEFDEA